KHRLIVVAPGLHYRVAKTLAERWKLLGPLAVSITLDVDPEVCRLGFGDIEAVKLLESTARNMCTLLTTHPGIRIGVIIADDETLIYAPTPLLIEASPDALNEDATSIKPNAIRVGLPPADLERDLGAGPDGEGERIIGLDLVEHETLAAVEADLKELPPQPFDITRRLRVFTAHLEFVELRMIGWNLSRRTVTLPAELVGVIDEENRALLESKFRVLANTNIEDHFTHLERIKEFIVKRFLVHLPSYGALLRLKDKPKFELAIQTLTKMLNRACLRAKRKLQEKIDQNIAKLAEALLPILKRKPPKHRQDCLMLEDDATWLTGELQSLAGSAEDMFKHAKVEVRYKGVTYETLNDKAFVEAVQARMKDMTRLHDETDAAPKVGAA
ncbi:MAG: hypothetical protein WD768_00770, partial [Phycisphaeraceae bacterium]